MQFLQYKDTNNTTSIEFQPFSKVSGKQRGHSKLLNLDSHDSHIPGNTHNNHRGRQSYPTTQSSLGDVIHWRVGGGLQTHSHKVSVEC